MEEVFDKIKEHANKAKDSGAGDKTVIEKTNNLVKPNKIKVFNKRNEKQN